MTKNEILKNASAFQRVCGAYVRHNLVCCVSTMMYDLRDVAERLEEYDTYMTLVSGKPDYEEAATQFILNDADIYQLEGIADEVGDWAEILEQSGVPANVDEIIEASETLCDLDDYLTANDLYDAVRRAVCGAVSDYGWVCQEFDLEPEYSEAFEHWVVDRWFGRQLEDQGQVVEEFLGLLIWARGTTGQSIAIDSVVERIVASLDDDHWVWGEA